LGLKGLAKEFSRRTVGHYLDTSASEAGVWLEVDDDNEPGIALYEGTGWQHVGARWDEDKEIGRNIMIFALEQ